MRKISTVKVTQDNLNKLFDNSQIWGKIKDGRLSSKVIKSDPSKSWTKATSQIILHFNKKGKHVATTHRVITDDGRVVHWDARNIRKGNTCYWIE